MESENEQKPRTVVFGWHTDCQCVTRFGTVKSTAASHPKRIPHDTVQTILEI